MSGVNAGEIARAPPKVLPGKTAGQRLSSTCPEVPERHPDTVAPPAMSRIGEQLHRGFTTRVDPCLLECGDRHRTEHPWQRWKSRMTSRRLSMARIMSSQRISPRLGGAIWAAITRHRIVWPRGSSHHPYVSLPP